MRSVGQLLICIALVFGGACHAAYKCVSPGGKVSFQDMPCDQASTSNELNIRSQPNQGASERKQGTASGTSEERSLARTACQRAQRRVELALEAMESMVNQSTDPTKREDALKAIENSRRKTQALSADKCADKYLSNQAYSTQVTCLAHAMTAREVGACMGKEI